MTNLERIKKAEELLAEAHKVLANVKTKDEGKNEAQREVLSDINEVYKKIRTNFNTSIWGEIENDMLNKFKVSNLMQAYYDNGMYELEFHVDDKKFILSNILEKHHPDAWEDEWYFENEEVLKEIMINANDEDIKEVK